MGSVNTASLLYLNGSLVLGTIIALIYFVRKSKIKSMGLAEIQRKRKIHNKYVRYSNNFITRKSFRKLAIQFVTMSCYDQEKIKDCTVTLYERTLFISLLMPVLAFITLDNILYAVLVGFVGYIYYNRCISGEINKIYVELIDETVTAIQSINDGYKLTDSIPQAVAQCDKGQYLEKAINQIYEILVDENGEEKLMRFKQATPVRLLGTLATVLYISNEEGDSREGGQSKFDLKMISLRQECETERRHLVNTRNAFKSLSTLALIGLAVAPLCDWFLLGQIPGTALLLKGMYGSVQKSVLIGTSIIAYYVISVLSQTAVVNQVDVQTWILKLSKTKLMKRILKDIIPKKFKTRYRWRQLMSEALTSKTLEYIYTAKVITSVGVFIIFLLFEIGYVGIAKDNLWNNHSSLGMIPDTLKKTERTVTQLRQVDTIYMTADEKMGQEETVNLVRSKVTDISLLEAQQQADRLSTKWDKYYAMGFKWYYVLFAYAAGIVGWFSQEVSILLRKKLVAFEAIEDVMQLQTLLITIADTSMDATKALYWLMQESIVHKAPLHYAYLEYTADSEIAIQRLKDSVGNSDLKRIVAKLDKAIYALSVRDAFSDIYLDKEQSLFNYTTLQAETLASKKEWARMISGVPVAITIWGGFVIPILALGVSQLMTAFATM